MFIRTLAATLFALGTALAPLKSDAASVAWDFTTANGSFAGSGIGNSYTDTVGGVSVTASAWRLNGNNFTAATVVRNGQGLGVCDLNVCPIGIGEAVDNLLLRDFLLFTFSQPADPLQVDLRGISVPLVGGFFDTDASYLVSNALPPLTTLSALGSLTNSNGGTVASRSFAVAGNDPVFSLLVGANPNQSNDRFRIAQVEARVSEPGVLAMLGLGLIGVLGARRRRA